MGPIVNDDVMACIIDCIPFKFIENPYLITKALLAVAMRRRFSMKVKGLQLVMHAMTIYPTNSWLCWGIVMCSTSALVSGFKGAAGEPWLELVYLSWDKGSITSCVTTEYFFYARSKNVLSVGVNRPYNVFLLTKCGTSLSSTE